jgi:hypothetical protein
MDARKEIYSKLNPVFKAKQLFLSQVGRDISTPTVDTATGTWVDKGLYNKTPRYIVQIKIDEQTGKIEAGQFRNNPTSSKLGYINTSNSENKVGGVLIRVLPVFIKSDGSFEAVGNWEWVLLLVFQSPISGGSSSDALDNFTPPLNTFDWVSRNNTVTVKVINSLLFKLPVMNNLYNYQGIHKNINVTYDDATTALTEFISFDFN